VTGAEVAVPATLLAGAVSAMVAAAADVDPGPTLSIGLTGAAGTGLAFVVWLLRRLDERAAEAKQETIRLLAKNSVDKDARIAELADEVRRLDGELARQTARLVEELSKDKPS